MSETVKASSQGSQQKKAGERGRRFRKSAATGSFVVLVGLLLTIVMVQAQGYQPLPTILEGLQYAVGNPVSIARTLAWGMPLCVAALGVAVAFRSGMFNIGAEGQIYAGALAAALVGVYVGPFFTGLHILIVTAVAALAGGAIAAGLGWLRAAWGVDEVLSTLLSNYIIILFCAYLVTNPLRDPTRQSGTTRQVSDTAMFSEIIPKTDLRSSIFVVVLLSIAVWWLSEKSILGYRWRMTGESSAFAAAVGINVKQARIGAMFASGALAGIAGSLLVTASQGRFWTQIGTGVGWDAVLIALIAQARILPTIGWVLVYTIMRSAARGVEQVSSVPSELSLILIAAIIVAAAARPGIFSQVDRLKERYFPRKVA